MLTSPKLIKDRFTNYIINLFNFVFNGLKFFKAASLNFQSKKKISTKWKDLEKKYNSAEAIKNVAWIDIFDKNYNLVDENMDSIYALTYKKIKILGEILNDTNTIRAETIRRAHSILFEDFFSKREFNDIYSIYKDYQNKCEKVIESDLDDSTKFNMIKVNTVTYRELIEKEFEVRTYYIESKPIQLFNSRRSKTNEEEEKEIADENIYDEEQKKETLTDIYSALERSFPYLRLDSIVESEYNLFIEKIKIKFDSVKTDSRRQLHNLKELEKIKDSINVHFFDHELQKYVYEELYVFIENTDNKINKFKNKDLVENLSRIKDLVSLYNKSFSERTIKRLDDYIENAFRNYNKIFTPANLK